MRDVRGLRFGNVLALTLLLAGCAHDSAQPQGGGDGAPKASQQPKVQEAPRPAVSTALQAPKATPRPSERSVYYDFDQSALRPEARGVVVANANYLREHPGLKVRVEGNSDERGSAEYNLALGQRRAEVVLKALELQGIPDDRIEAVSFGKEKPKKLGHDEASWAENRRSDIVY